MPEETTFEFGVAKYDFSTALLAMKKGHSANIYDLEVSLADAEDGSMKLLLDGFEYAPSYDQLNDWINQTTWEITEATFAPAIEA